MDLTGYTTEQSADDIDDLRAALGEEQISLWGASYGSHLALATIKRHGDRVHRAVIPMVEGPDHTIKLPSNIQRQIETIAARVRSDPAVSARVLDLPALMREVIDRLAAAPVMVEVPDAATNQTVKVAVSAFDLKKTTASGLGDIEFISRLPAHYAAMAQGDFTWPATYLLDWRRSWFSNAMGFVMDSASGASPERLAQIQREARETLLEDLIDFPFPYVADAWGAPDLGPEFRAPVRSNVPVLFISGTLDGRTPVSNAEEVRTGFPNGHHLIVDGMAHGVPDTPEITGATVDFLSSKPVTIERSTVPFAFAPVGG
ncbi:MAG: alpha/beta hydrolase [Dehalococcoidia bacterium]